MGMSNAERQRKFRMNRDADPERRQNYLQSDWSEVGCGIMSCVYGVLLLCCSTVSVLIDIILKRLKYYRQGVKPNKQVLTMSPSTKYNPLYFQKMGMSNAERQRKFRMNRDADPERRQNYLQKCKNKYKEDKAVGRKKLAKDMTPRELRQTRKYWRLKKKQQRQKKKDIEEIVTPPSTPETIPINRQIQQSKRKKKRAEAKCYRDNKLKDKEIESLKKKVELYKKRWQREAAKYRERDSPRTKTRRLLKNFSKKNVRRVLFDYHVLIKQLQQKYVEEKKL